MNTPVIDTHEQQLRSDFLLAMRYTPASVAVVTTDGHAGRGGVTVSAFSSLSADPPSVLVCIHQLSPVLSLIQRNGVMCVNLLHANQTHVADSFAGRIAQWREDRFACAQWNVASGTAPQLEGALANLHCKLEQDIVFGSHHILIGTLEQVHSNAAPALLYADRAYRQVGSNAPIQEALYA